MTLDPWSIEIRSFVAGVDQDVLYEDAPDGFGLPAPNTSDQALMGHGTAGGSDRAQLRPMEFPLLIAVDSATDAEDLLAEVKEAWVYSDDETALDVRFAGEERRYFGRTRGLDANLADFHHGVITGLLAHFDALDPWGYGPEEASTEDDDDGDTLTIVNAGNVPNPLRARCVLTATVDDPNGTITNLDDVDGLTMTFNGMEGDEVVIDLAAWTVAADSVLRGRLLLPGSGWPVLKPGNNRFAYTGFSALAATWRPPYL